MGVMLQAFYCPEVEDMPFGWWTYLRGDMPELAVATFTALWLAPANNLGFCNPTVIQTQ